MRFDLPVALTSIVLFGAASAAPLSPLLLLSRLGPDGLPALAVHGSERLGVERAATAPGGTWAEELATQPEGNCAIYDPVADRMLVLGRGSVWSLQLTAPWDWTLVPAGGTAPLASAIERAVYDPPHGRVIAIGFSGSYSIAAWTLTLSTMQWSPLVAIGTPPPNYWYPSATYDPVRQRVLVIGGYNGGQYTNEVWSLSLTGAPTWTQIMPAGTPPPGRAFHVAVYDPVRDCVLVQGGMNGEYAYGLWDLWTLSLSGTPTWSSVTTTHALPSGLAIHTAVYDAKRDRMIVFGGINGGPPNAGVWSFVPAPTPDWVAMTSGGEIGGRSWHTAILDTVRDQMVVFGGRGPTTYPYYHDAIALSLGDTRTWMGLSPLPKSRNNAAVALDAVHGRLFVFGGYDGDYTFLSDLWEYDLYGAHRWTRIEAPGGPGARDQARMLYDAPHDRLVLFGGFDGTMSLGDTWTFACAAQEWSEAPVAGPGARHGEVLAHDPAHQRAVLFGGGSASGGVVGLRNDAWLLSLADVPTWTLVTPAGGGPVPRFFHAGAYDPSHERLIVHGGVSFGTYWPDTLLADTWELRLGSSPAWGEIPPISDTWPGQPPDEFGRYGHELVFDHYRSRLLLFGGYDGAALHSDVWQLDLVNDGDWSLADMSGGPPEPRAFAGVGFDDTRGNLVVFGAGGPGNDVWVGHLDEPAAVEPVPREPSRLALAGAAPNPACGASLTVAFTLASAQPATLTLLDVAGRRAASLDVGVLGAGAHRVSLALPRGAPAGVYWLALAQAGERASARVAIVR